jgi:hypothetical protein
MGRPGEVLTGTGRCHIFLNKLAASSLKRLEAGPTGIEPKLHRKHGLFVLFTAGTLLNK